MRRHARQDRVEVLRVPAPQRVSCDRLIGHVFVEIAQFPGAHFGCQGHGEELLDDRGIVATRKGIDQLSPQEFIVRRGEDLDEPVREGRTS